MGWFNKTAVKTAKTHKRDSSLVGKTTGWAKLFFIKTTIVVPRNARRAAVLIDEADAPKVVGMDTYKQYLKEDSKELKRLYKQLKKAKKKSTKTDLRRAINHLKDEQVVCRKGLSKYRSI